MDEKDARMLPVRLSEEEVHQRSRTLARMTIERDEIEEEKKASAKVFTDRLKEYDSQIHDLADAVNTSKEKRLVGIQEQHDKRRFCVDTVRIDTMETIDTRAMTADEVDEARQPALFEDARRSADSRDDVAPADDDDRRTKVSHGFSGSPLEPVRPVGSAKCPDCGTVGGHSLECSALANSAEASVPSTERVPVAGAIECPQCASTDFHVDGCPIAFGIVTAKGDRKRACQSCGIVGGHRSDCTRVEDATPPGPDDVTDPAALLAAAAEKPVLQ